MLTAEQEKRRQELHRLKRVHNLTNEGISLKLPKGAAKKTTVDKWMSGNRAVPVLIMDVLYHVLEGREIRSKGNE